MTNHHRIVVLCLWAAAGLASSRALAQPAAPETPVSEVGEQESPYDEPSAPDEAAPAPGPTPPPPDADPLPVGDGLTLQEAERRADKAKELNRHGVRLLDAGDVERALEHFLASRDILPTTKNVANAAICLERLGRYDESLELLEQLLKELAGGLDDEDRAAIGPMMEDLRARVASLDVDSNVGGTLLVDGRERAKLPLQTPIRVLGGLRRVRVVKNGFESYEAEIDAKTGQRTAISVELRPLKGVGQLVVDDVAAPGADIFIDGSKVGVSPWEGSLAPGEHFVWLRKDELGTAPAKVVIVEGQAALLSLKIEPLGAPVRVVSLPAAAHIELEGTSLGTGSWIGRLPIGSYRFRVSEPGYREQTVSFDSAPGGGERALRIELPLEPDHPRWPKPVRGDFWIDAFGGFSGGPTLGSTAGEVCPRSCDGSTTVTGLLAGLRGGYRFPFGLSAEVSAGYWRLSSSFDRTLVDDQPSSRVTFDVRDQILVHGPFAGAGVSYRGFIDSPKRLHLIGRATIGALLVNASDPVTGVASTGGGTGEVAVEDRNQTLTSVAPFIMPEIGIGYRFGSLTAAIGLGVGFFPTEGPEFDRGRVGIDASASSVGGPAPRESTVLDGESAYSSFLLWVPQASVGWTL